MNPWTILAWLIVAGLVLGFIALVIAVVCWLLTYQDMKLREKSWQSFSRENLRPTRRR